MFMFNSQSHPGIDTCRQQQCLTVQRQRHITIIAYRATSRIMQLQQRFCVTDRTGVQPIGDRLSLHLRTTTYNQTVIRSPGLPF